MLCWSATFAPSTWRLSALPRSCQVSSRALREARGAERVALRDQSARRVDDRPVAAVGRRLGLDQLVALALLGEPERLVGDQLVGREAVVQLAHVHVLGAAIPASS